MSSCIVSDGANMEGIARFAIAETVTAATQTTAAMPVTQLNRRVVESGVLRFDSQSTSLINVLPNTQLLMICEIPSR